MIVKVEIIHENEQGEHTFISFEGDELTSPLHEAEAFFHQELQKEMVV